MLDVSPEIRPSAREVLDHPWFKLNLSMNKDHEDLLLQEVV
jgi:hypothetical protein